MEVDCSWVPIIEYIYNCGILKIIDKLNINFLYPIQMINYPFNNQILESIQRKEAIAVTNTSVDRNLMGGVWLITTKTKDFELEYKLYLKD